MCPKYPKITMFFLIIFWAFFTVYMREKKMSRKISGLEKIKSALLDIAPTGWCQNEVTHEMNKMKKFQRGHAKKRLVT